MKNKVFLRIFVVAFSLFLLVSCFVIAPSADTYDDNCIHYWYYFNYTDRPTYNVNYAFDTATFYYNSPTNQKLTFVYGKDINGNNLFTYHLFKEVSIFYQNFYGIEDGLDYNEYVMILMFDHNFITNHQIPPSNYARITYYWQDDAMIDIHLEVYGVAGIPYASLHWGPADGNYNLQLWLNPNALMNVEAQSIYDNRPVDTNGLIDSMFRRAVISYPKTYSDGYVAGNDFGYEQGYGDGFDQGNIDGIQQGITEGYDIGFQDGLDDGYSLGFDDGRMDGIEEGYRDGYDDAKAVYDTTEAWQDMKSLIFAIFDAPFYVISYSLDFNLFGINVAGTLIALISTALIVWLLKIIIVKFF